MSEYQIPVNIIKSFITNFIYVDDKMWWEYPGIEEENIIDDQNGIEDIEEEEPEEFEELLPPPNPEEEKMHTKSYDEFLSRMVYESISKGEYICDLFKYENKKLNLCKNICRKADVIILDWELDPRGSGHEPTLDIINFLKENNVLKFIYIYTVIDRQETIKENIERKLNISCEGDYKNFKCNSLYFFVRSKKIETGINPKDILDSIIDAISNNYTGIMAAMNMEFISNVKKSLPIIISEKTNLIDSPIISLLSNSKEREFNDIISKILLSDIEQLVFLYNEKSYLKLKSNLKKNMKDKKIFKKMEEIIRENDMNEMGKFEIKIIKKLFKIYQNNSGIIVTHDMEKIIDDKVIFFNYIYKILNDLKVNSKIKGINDELIIDRNRLSFQIISILLYILIYDTSIDRLNPDEFIKSHMYFQIKLSNINNNIIFPSISQGTILKNQNRYYLCITPLCDILRPSKINNKYMFTMGEEIHIHNVGFINNNKNSFSIFEEETDIKIIKWNLYEIISYVIEINELDEDNNINVIDIEGKTISLQKITTLRSDNVTSLINTCVSNIGRIGIDSDEVIRLRSSRNN